MPEIIEGVSPTRMELLRLSRREKLAEKGHDLLREKRDALIAEFLDIIGEVRDIRKEVEAKLGEAFESLILAQALSGVEQVRQQSLMTGHRILIDSSTRSIMGVQIPILELSDKLVRNVTERGYSLIDSSSALDRAARSFEEALQLIIKLGEMEEAVRNLAGEVEKTKRRVNALEYIMLSLIHI